MAGDWIKMRGNLWDDPRVTKLCDMTDQSEATIVGALYWLWAMADQHTEDGYLDGLTTRQIDRKTGVQGFANALASIGWIEVNEHGITIVRFEDHNGDSAKKRCQGSKRAAKHRTSNAEVTQPALRERYESVTSALAREEKRREEKIKENSLSGVKENPTSPPAEVCKAMKAEGIGDVNPGHTDLRQLLETGSTVQDFIDAARTAANKGKGFAYAIAIVKSRREEAARPTPSGGLLSKHGEQTARNAAIAAEMIFGKQQQQDTA